MIHLRYWLMRKEISFDELNRDTHGNPVNFTLWFEDIYQEVNYHLVNIKNYSL